MVIKGKMLQEIDHYTSYTDTEHSFMNLDVGIIRLNKNEEYIISASDKEKAIDLLNGKVAIEIINNRKNKTEKYIFNRNSIFHERASVVHVDCTFGIKITGLSDKCELVYEATFNTENKFGCKIYYPEDIVISEGGINQSGNLARRKIIEFFSHETAPYSNMVMGEIIGEPGNWSSWPPHRHFQPEMYLYRFNKDEGFAASFEGDEVYKVMNNDAICIAGQQLHPVVCAPDFLMFYMWMIPNNINKPWTDRNYDPDYAWTTTNDYEKSKME